MRVKGLPGAFYHLARHRPPELSAQAQERLRYLSCWEALREQGLSSTQASQRLGLPRSTLYRWAQRLKCHGPQGREERSHAPQHRRQPTWSPELAQAVFTLREECPCRGKDKLVVLLRRQGVRLSTSMVGRILTRLKARGVLKEPPRQGIFARRRPRPRPYAVRKPREYQARKPGDLVQVGTLDVRPLPGLILKHFTARDVVCRWDVVELHTRATATVAATFLDTLLARMPFKVRAIQVDGGSEFQAVFEQACQRRGLRLFVLPPRSPKLNGCAERAQRTHREEFYDRYDGDVGTSALNQARPCRPGSTLTTPSAPTRPWTAVPHWSTLHTATRNWPHCPYVLNEYTLTSAD